MTSPAPTTTFLDRDFYVPTFKVVLVGQTLGSSVVRDITQVSYKDSLDQIDSFEITISNWDDGQSTYQDVRKRKYKYSDQDLFDPGKRIELWMGYFGKGNTDVKKMITGEITSLRPSFSSGPPTLVISGLNVLHALRKKQESFPYPNKTDSDIASAIAKRLNLDFKPDPTAAAAEKPYNYLLQDNQYDIVFLLERARRIGYDLFVKEPDQTGNKPVLHFQPSLDVRKVAYQLNYGSSLIEFQPNLTTAKQVGHVIVRGWDAVNKKPIEGKADRSQLKIKTEPSIEESFDQRQEIMATVPVRSLEEANNLALQTLTNISKDMVKATGSTVGLPDLRAGSLIELAGLGKRFSKQYFVTATTHTIGDGGYTTQFECRLEDQAGNTNASGQK